MKRHFAPAARWALCACVAAACLAACTITPAPKAPAPVPAPAPVAPPPQAAMPVTPPPANPLGLSTAATPRAYRADAAGHLYRQYQDRIYQGKLPPLLYAVGVLQVDVNAKGEVTSTSWMRAPKHAPQVVAEIERLVRKAEPYPVPVRMGKVTYTDTWLWDKSGKFQLDTLTEGQL